MSTVHGENNPNLPENYGLALGRLKTTISRLQQDSELLKKYDEVIKDQLKKGIIEIVRDETTDDKLIKCQCKGTDSL